MDKFYFNKESDPDLFEGRTGTFASSVRLSKYQLSGWVISLDDKYIYNIDSLSNSHQSIVLALHEYLNKKFKGRHPMQSALNDKIQQIQEESDRNSAKWFQHVIDQCKDNVAECEKELAANKCRMELLTFILDIHTLSGRSRVLRLANTISQYDGEALMNVVGRIVVTKSTSKPSQGKALGLSSLSYTYPVPRLKPQESVYSTICGEGIVYDHFNNLTKGVTDIAKWLELIFEVGTKPLEPEQVAKISELKKESS